MRHLILLALLLLSQNQARAEESAPSIPEVAKPPALAAFLPSTIHGLATADVAGGKYKLVSWTHYSDKSPNWSSRIALLSVESGKPAKVVWQTEEEELYDPEIRSIPEWKYHGHPVLLVIRHAGAAAVVAEPLVETNGTIARLKSYDGDNVEVAQLKGSKQAHQLIVHIRPEDQLLDVPKIYEWNGTGFADGSRHYPQYYANLLVKSREILADADSGISTRYGAALLMDLAGKRGEAVSTLKSIKTQLAKSGAAKNKDLQNSVQKQLNQLLASKR